MKHKSEHPLDIDILDFAEDKLDNIERRKLRAHLTTCGWCLMKLIRIHHEFLNSEIREYHES